MKGYFYRINKNDFSFSFINDTDESHDMWSDRDKWSHYPILHRILNFMHLRGFCIERDPDVKKNYKSLNKDHWYGKKGYLEFKAKRYPRGFKINFFQNINTKNKSGGEYDFNKFELAPYLIKIMFINETNKIENFIKTIVPEITCKTDRDFKKAEDKIKKSYVDSWHKPQKNLNFSLNEIDNTTCEETYNNVDRDKKTIYNGQIKYFRNYTGRLQRGKVYHNINNMWWIIVNDTEVRNVASFELFNATIEDFKVRRKVKDIKPKEYIDKLESIKKLTDKDLIKELKNRGFKINNNFRAIKSNF